MSESHRQPGERHPDADKAVPIREYMNAERYQEYKRLERERLLRESVAVSRELTDEEAAYVARCRAKTARLDIVLSPTDKSTLQAMADLHGVGMTGYLLSLHRTNVNAFMAQADADTVAEFTAMTERAFTQITGERTLAVLEDELMGQA